MTQGITSFQPETKILTAFSKAKGIMDKESFKQNQGFCEAPNFVNGKEISDNRKYKRLLVLTKLSKQTGKPFGKTTEKDLETFMKGISNDHSRESYAAIFKSFYRWLNEKKFEYLIKCKALKVQSPYSQPGNVIDSKDLLSEKECLALIQAAQTKRDKSLFAILIGGGFRIGECNIKRKDIAFCTDNSIIISVRGKTGLREVKIHNGLAKYVREWFEEMPTKDPERNLFITLDGKNNCSYSVLNKMLRRAKARAGITKPLTFHKLRHRHATWTLVNLPRQLAYKRMGWTANSDMARVYSHVDDMQANDAYEQALGLKPANTGKEMELQEKQCLNCGKTFEPTRELCSDCGIPLGQIVLGAKDAMLFKEMVEWFAKNKARI